VQIVNYLDILEEAWQQHLAPREANAPTVVSLFAGCGGSSLGYSMAGYRKLLAVEWNKCAAETFRCNFPDVPIYLGDIAKLSVEECFELAKLQGPEELSVLDGSPPCQGFSMAGKRDPGDIRNQMYKEYVRLLRGLRPQVFIMENVPGLLQNKMKSILTDILYELQASDYAVAMKVLNAMHFCVPQSRRRVIFIGVRKDLGIEPSYPAKEVETPVSLQEALLNVPSDFRKQPNVTPLRAARWRETAQGSVHKERFSLYRLAWNKPAPTVLRTSGSGGHMHPDEPRLLNIPELQRISSFPDAFEFPETWNNCVQCIGNSVPPLFMRAIAEHVRDNILCL